MLKIFRSNRHVRLTIAAVAFLLWPSAGSLRAQDKNACKCPATKKPDICINTQGDSATPTRIPDPITRMNKTQVILEIGPLSPIESCSLTSVTSTPSTLTSQASLERLIGTLLGTSIAAPTVTAGAEHSFVFNPEIGQAGGNPAENALKQAETELAGANFAVWIARHQAAVGALSIGQRLLTIGARQPLDTSDHAVKQFLKACTDAEGASCEGDPAKQFHFLAACLDEENKPCFDKKGTREKAVNSEEKLEFEGHLAKALSYLATAAGLLKPSADPDDLNRLENDEASAAALQNADTKLRATEAIMATAYAQVAKVWQHVSGPTSIVDDRHLYEALDLTPARDSDLSASVTCTSLVDNSITLGPVPIAIHAGIPLFVFSAGAVISLTPVQSFGEIPVNDPNAASGFDTEIEATTTNRFQAIPFAFETFRFLPWRQEHWKVAGFEGLGLTGGLGFNPYSGVTGVDFFSGLSVRITNKIYLHGGLHSGRYVYLDRNSGFDVSKALPSGFPSSVPTVTRFTHHLALAASYSF
jgi:hypothetical protein